MAQASRPDPSSAPAPLWTSDWRVNLWVMFAVQFLMMMGANASNPLLPLFLEGELGLPRGHVLELWSGLVTSAHFFTMSFMSPVWGSLADRHGRKLMVMRTTAAVGIFNILYMFVQNQYQLFFVRLCMGIFSGFGGTALALVGASTPKEKLGYALGTMGTGQLLGTVLGPLLGGAVCSRYGFRLAFLTTSVLSLLAFVLTAAMIRENFVKPTANEVAARPGLAKTIVSVAKAPGISPFFVTLVLAQLAVAGVSPVTTLFIGELGVAENMVPVVAGLAIAVAGLGAALTAPLLGRLADRIGYSLVLFGSIAGTAIFYFPLTLAHAAWQVVALRFVVGLFTGGIQPAAYALIGRLAPKGRQSAAYGLTFSAASVGNFSGPLLSGIVAASAGLRAVFLYTSILVAFNALWVLTRVRKAARTEEGDALPRKADARD